MLLRDHRLNSRHGVPNWPPVGIWIGELENTHTTALFNDYALCQQAAEHFLQFYCNASIADVGLASSFPVVLRLLKKRRKAKGGTKTWKQNKK